MTALTSRNGIFWRGLLVLNMVHCTQDVSCLITADPVSWAGVTAYGRDSSKCQVLLRCCLPGWSLKRRKKKAILKLIFSSPVAQLQVKENEDLIVLKAQLHFWEWFWRNGINWLQSSLTVSILFRGLKKTDTVTALHFQPRLRSCRRLHLNSSSNLWVSHLVRPLQSKYRASTASDLHWWA